MTVARPRQADLAPAWLKQGNAIEVCKWQPGGAKYELQSGRYYGIEDGAWLIVRGDRLLRLPRDEWELVLR